MKAFHENKAHILSEIKKDWLEYDQENIDNYREYFNKFKTLVLNKLRRAHLQLEEVSNERDEFKDSLYAMKSVLFFNIFHIILRIFFLKKK